MTLFSELRFKTQLFLRLCYVSFMFPSLSVVRLVTPSFRVVSSVAFDARDGSLPDALLIVTAHTKTLRGV